jgi:hypothetical protein
VGFASPTSAGSFLLLSGFATAVGTLVSDVTPLPPITSGIVWSQTGGAGGYDPGGIGNGGAVGIYYCANAASIGTAVTTVMPVALSGSGFTCTVAGEFALYEFSGIATTSPFDRGNAGHQNSINASTPNAGNLTTTANDLLIAAFTTAIASSNTGAANISAGPSYTLGVNMTVAAVGQFQYQLNVPAGTYSTAFTGTEPIWGAAAVAYKAATSSAAAAITTSQGFMLL